MFFGLKPNYNKTCCVKIGLIRSAELNFVKRYDIQWSQDPFTFLGITFTYTERQKKRYKI